jgi:adenosine kinase
MRREFGGCAGNIAYNLRLLGERPLIMATVGEDYQPYAYRLDRLKLPQTHIRQVKDTFTAQAFITTDLDDNQITAFHPGAMNHSHLNRVTDAKDVTLGIVAPDGRQGMIDHVRQFHQAGIPFIFDPGQGMPMFNGEELLEFVRLADYVAVNDYEARLLQEKTSRSIVELASMVKAFIVTQGAEGSLIHTERETHRIPSAKPQAVLDPTGCGDAYRAGLLYGIGHAWDWPTTGRLASLMGAVKIASRGGQNHQVTRDEIGARFKEAFATSIW